MAKTQNKTFAEKLQDSLATIRQFIQNDGGDLQYLDFKNGILFLQVLGHCAGCINFEIDFQSVKPFLMSEFPEIKDVVFVPKKTVW